MAGPVKNRLEQNAYVSAMAFIEDGDFSNAIDQLTVCIEKCSSSDLEKKRTNGCDGCDNNRDCGKLFYHRGFAYLRRKSKGDIKKAEADFIMAGEKFFRANGIFEDFLLLAETYINLNICLTKYENENSKQINDRIFKYLTNAIRCVQYAMRNKEPDNESNFLLGRLFYERGKRFRSFEQIKSEVISLFASSEPFTLEREKSLREEIDSFKEIEARRKDAIKDFKTAIYYLNQITSALDQRNYIVRTIANLIIYDSQEDLDNEIKAAQEKYSEELNKIPITLVENKPLPNGNARINGLNKEVEEFLIEKEEEEINGLDDIINKYFGPDICNLTMKERINAYIEKMELEEEKTNNFEPTICHQTHIFRVSTSKISYNSNWFTQAYGVVNRISKDKGINHLHAYLKKETGELLKNSFKLPSGGTFYKFYSLNTKSVEYLLQNIARNRVFFATPEDFNASNDTQDITVLRDAIIDNSTYAELFRDFLKEMNPKVLCLTLTYRNYALWLHYANNFKGICVEYELDNDELIKIYEEKEKNKDTDKVMKTVSDIVDYYGDKYLFAPIEYKSSQEFRNLLIRNGESSITDTIKNVLYAKYDHFSYEKEYRLIKLCGKNTLTNGVVDLVYDKKEMDYSSQLKGRMKRILIGNRDFIYDQGSGIRKVSNFSNVGDDICFRMREFLLASEVFDLLRLLNEFSENTNSDFRKAIIRLTEIETLKKWMESHQIELTDKTLEIETMETWQKQPNDREENSLENKYLTPVKILKDRRTFEFCNIDRKKAIEYLNRQVK